MIDEDRDLRDAFARLREAESRAIPAFRKPEGRRDAGATRWRFAVVAAMLVIAIAVGYLARRTPPEVGRHSTAPPISTWRAPTDVLLQTPGHELLDSVPQLQPQIPGGRS